MVLHLVQFAGCESGALPSATWRHSYLALYWSDPLSFVHTLQITGKLKNQITVREQTLLFGYNFKRHLLILGAYFLKILNLNLSICHCSPEILCILRLGRVSVTDTSSLYKEPNQVSCYLIIITKVQCWQIEKITVVMFPSPERLLIITHGLIVFS